MTMVPERLTGTGITTTTPSLANPDPVPLLAELAADVPVVLLPVRLETKWFATAVAGTLELRIRVFPDEIHVAEDTAPTEHERQQIVAYQQVRTQSGANSEADQAARTRLNAQIGLGRTAFLLRVLEPGSASGAAELAAATAVDGTRAFGLPTRWHAIARAPGLRVVATGLPIPPDLAIAPVAGDVDVASRPALGSKMAWVTDFAAAEAVGMAIKMQMSAADAARLDELIVVGVQSTTAPEVGSSKLGEIIARHACGQGAQLLPPGTPTNNTEQGAAMDLVRYPVLLASTPDAGSAGARLRDALGIQPTSMRDVVASRTVSGANADAIVNAMHTVMWPATWGHFLQQMMPLPAVDIAGGRALFAEYVRPGGHFWALRVRAQPYAVLPVTSTARWNKSQPCARLADTLTKLCARWQPLIATVPRLVGTKDGDRDLLATLRARPRSTHWAVRPGITRDAAVVAAMAGGAKIELAAAAVDRVVSAVKKSVGLDTLAITAMARVLDVVFEDAALRVTVPLVAHDDRPRDQALAKTDNYLRGLAEGKSSDLAAHQVPGAAKPTLLYLLARHATVATRAAAADTVLKTKADAVDEFAVRKGVASVWDRMGLVSVASIAANKDVAAHHQALQTLGVANVDELEDAMAGALDASSHRVDAWVTALAAQRLAQVRVSKPQASYVGGWGWLEKPRPAAAPVRSNGFLHAPSLAQARTAAVMRSGYQAHRNDDAGATLAIDLSSDKVSIARWLLAAMRDGRALSRLLGDRLERWLESNGGAARIAPLRAQFPGATTGAGTAPLVDGWAAAKYWTEHVPTDSIDVAAANMLLGIVDAASDVLLADAVHHAVIGNPARTAAALDTLERGDAVATMTMVDRCASDGEQRQWRVAVTLPEGVQWAGAPRPRAVAAPRLDAFAARIIGDSQTVIVDVTVVTAGVSVNVPRRLADLDVCALDVVALVKTGGAQALLDLAVASVGATATAAKGRSALDDVVVRAAAVARLLAAARAPLADDFATAVIGTAADRSATIRNAIATLGTRPLAAAALVGSGVARDNAALASAVAALSTAAGSGDARREVVGDAVPISLPITGWPSLIAQKDAETTAWLADVGRVRPGMEALDLIVMLTPRALGAAAQLTTATGAKLVVFGPTTGTGIEAIVVDGWTEIGPAKEINSGASFQFDAPNTQPPQSILIAVPPPATPWSLDLLEAIVAETMALVPLRMFSPEVVHNQLLPATYLADDPSQTTAATDLLAYSALVKS